MSEIVKLQQIILCASPAPCRCVFQHQCDQAAHLESNSDSESEITELLEKKKKITTRVTRLRNLLNPEEP